MRELFRCDGVSKSYGGTGVVEDVSLWLGQGEFVSLLGQSGVGKTTLFNILAGVDLPDSGRVLLEGEDITGRAGKISYMLQKDLLLPFKTVADNVSLPLRLAGMPKRQAVQKAGALFGKFGLEGCENKYPHQLSGGMRQRAALLRTHFLPNKVLLLDEPFSALDAMTKSEMHWWFQDMAVELGLSVLCITHDVDEAIVLSDRIYIMAGVPGKICHEMPVEVSRPRGEEFLLSEDFLRCKKGLLQEIHNSR